jgi:hypothetical protein
MAYRVEMPLPRVVEIGRTATLDLPVRTAAGAVVEVTSGTLTVKLGSVVLVDEASIVAGSATVDATYSLLGTVHDDLEPSDDYLETWTTPVGVFTVSGYLVLTAYHSHVTDTALEGYHPELLDLLPPGETTAEKFRTMASERVQRELIKRGRRPWLIFDEWALYDSESYLALSYWASDASLRTTGTTDYARLAREYMTMFQSDWNAVAFRYDEDEDGDISEGEEMETAAPAGITLTAGRPRAYGGVPAYHPLSVA